MKKIILEPAEGAKGSQCIGEKITNTLDSLPDKLAIVNGYAMRGRIRRSPTFIPTD